MSDKKFNDETSKVIWNKLKGKDVPETYSDKDKEEIVKHYWHKAMESEQ
jgi:hypothetical protein